MTDTPDPPPVLPPPPVDPSPAPAPACPASTAPPEETPRPSRWQRFWKDATRKALLVAGAIVFAHLGSLTVHELGHALNLVATGGSVDYIQVTFWGESRVMGLNYRESAAFTWGGYLWQILVPVLLFLALWTLWPRVSFWALVLLIGGLLSAGNYLLEGTAQDYMDPHGLIAAGVSKTALRTIAYCLLSAAIPALPLAAALAGLGFRRCPWKTTIVALAIPAIAFWATRTIVTVPWDRVDFDWRTPAHFGVIVAVGVVAATLLHFLAGLFRWGSIRRHEVRPASWWPAGVSLALAGGVVALAMTAFPVRHRTPAQELYYAMGNGAKDVSYWIERGAKPDGEPGGWPPIYLAIGYERLELVQCFLRHGADVNRHTYGTTPLLWACGMRGREPIIRLLLDYGARVNVADEAGRTPLHDAAGCGDANTVLLLIQRGADASARNLEGNMPLHQTYSMEVARHLLDARAPVNAANCSGETPLIRMARIGTAEFISLLLQRGADIHARDAAGNTALHRAAGFGSDTAVAALLAAGADPAARNAAGETPLDRAIRFNRTKIEPILRNWRPPTRPATAPAQPNWSLSP